MACMFIMAFVWPVPLALAALGAADPANAPAPEAAPTQLIQAVGDAVLAHQIDPPSRQEMICSGIKAASNAAGVPVPAGLGRRVSAMAAPEQFAALVEETWPWSPERKETTPERLTYAFIEGMLQAIPSETRLFTAKEAKVHEQLQGNLYVGIHVQIDFDLAETRPKIVRALEGGPAQRAGVLGGDLIDEIDGKDAAGMSTNELVDRIRGEEGTDVELVFRQPKSKEQRRLMITRRRLFRPTIKGVRERVTGGWDARIHESDPIAYLNIESIDGSTPHELRQFARQLESEGFRALVLDLRSLAHADFHATVLLADELLDGGTIGRVRTADRGMTYQAQPDALFRGWPLAVLINQTTVGPAEWLAAALQDNHRATLVGTRTWGDAAAKTIVPVAGGDWAIEMVTRILERADGRPIGVLLPAQPGQGIAFPARQPQKGRLDQGGVKPDHPFAAADAMVRPGLSGSRPLPATDEKSQDLLDLTSKEALRLLSEELKATGDAGQ
ncbi:S41 family peptidase [Singulisphaera acidiphila]|uniref:Periplasmic protease n=1 Tax=Singulisphaera acidiphila (strain ATCC BAA-1392 / DSM 18658 / VKM B-2454 / MOB10) TaxID=886293 RepID=L0D6V5_SINAD|nr:S41 family peptidase [Singulisphaera acidiphila]AGA25139.1 periplasmic protease [Singulisphaera acidiphila DSM 18658]